MSDYSDNGRLCMGCMNPLPDGREKCGICGFSASGNNDKQYLRVGTLLSDRYLVGKLLEHVGDAAIYIGFDRAKGGAILIREFLPDTSPSAGKTGTANHHRM